MSRYQELVGIWYYSGFMTLWGIREIPNLWREVPAFANMLPRAAHLMHIILQQPPSARWEAAFDRIYISTLMRQLVQLVEGAAAAEGPGLCSSSSSSSASEPIQQLQQLPAQPGRQCSVLGPVHPVPPARGEAP